MSRYRVLLQGRDVHFDLDGQPFVGGFYINCCVEASDDQAAGEGAIAHLRAHPKYQALLNGYDGNPRQPAEPILLVNEVERLSWWDRHPLGITTGFVFYTDPDEAPLN